MANPDERTSTSVKVPGSGASTQPTTAKPANVPPAKDQRSAPNERPTTSVRPNVTAQQISPDFDFEIKSGTPRSASADAISTDNPPPETTQGMAPPQQTGPRPSDLPSTMRIKFRGEEREYPIDTIKTLAQQGLNVSADSPVLQMISEIRRQTGVNDPRKLAEMVGTAVQRMMSMAGAGGPNGAGLPPGANGPGAGAGAAPGARAAGAMANVQAGAGAGGLNMPPPVDNADDVVNEFERTNGLTLPDAMRAAITNVVKHGQSLDKMVNTYGGMYNQVQNFANELKQRSQSALASAVNTEASRVAQELGIDTQEEVQAFAQFVSETDSEFPGFKQQVLSSPKAMAAAVRKFYFMRTGQAAVQEREAAKQKVNTDLLRAGGDMVSPRPGGPATPVVNGQDNEGDETTQFNQDLMQRM